MLRRFVIAAALAGGLSLGGCAGVTPATIQTDINTIVAQVQQGVAAACGFLPTVATVVAVINGPVGAAVGTAVTYICGAFATATATTAKSRMSARYGAGVRTLYCSGSICGYKLA